ncbi:hypothetical protein [Halosimplex sp. TS25]|uniref:hypothetical protein n=1 Tax=Halosimplex rarum TaxID=3396619 RepID=UPI0039ED547C
MLFLSNLTTLTRFDWLWVAGGFVATVLVLGPVAQSSLAARASERSHAGGVLAGVAVVAGFIALAWIVREVLGVPQPFLRGLASGVFLAVAAFTSVRVLARRSVEGW